MMNSPQIGVQMLKSNGKNVIQQGLCQVNLEIMALKMQSQMEVAQQYSQKL